MQFFSAQTGREIPKVVFSYQRDADRFLFIFRPYPVDNDRRTIRGQGGGDMETRTRWTVLWFLVLISVVRSMDAVNFSVAAKQIMPEYGFTNVQMGMLYTVFTAGYA